MYFINFSFPITLTLIVFYLFLIFNLFSKFLLTDICLPFTFYFDLLLLFIFLFFLFFTYVLFLVFTRTSNPPHLPPFVRGALFFLCRCTNIYNFLGCVPISRHVPRLCILFNFFYFSQWILILLVREKHRKTLYRFLLAKIKGWDKNNRDKNSEHDKQITK